YIEAHGTGTQLGDPIEVGALEAVYGKERDPNHPLILGTVKTNIGHLESAAGIAGLIKTILSLQYKIIPKHLNFHTLNPHINLQAIPAEIPLEIREWEYRGHTRCAGVSSFGFSGTNVHLIVEAAPLREEIVIPAEIQQQLTEQQHLLIISAKTESALAQQIEHYVEYLKSTRSTIQDICYTSQIARTCFHKVVAVVGKTREELVAHLENQSFIAETNIDNPIYSYSDEIKPYLKKVFLPTYPFQHQPYWFSKKSKQYFYNQPWEGVIPKNEWALPADWFFYLKEEESDSMSTTTTLAFQRLVLLTCADGASEYQLFIETLKDSFMSLGMECIVLRYSELAACAAQSITPMCVLDIASYVPLLPQLMPEVDAIEVLLQRYQALVSSCSHVVRWVMVGSTAEEHQLSQQVLLNLAQVLNWECEFAVSYVGLAEFTKIEAAYLAKETLYGDEPQVKFAAGKRYVTRLEKADSLLFLNQTEPVSLTEGTYLITGGLGGLGFQLMQELLSLGATQIALLSRHEMTVEQAEKLQEVHGVYPAEVKHYAVDVSDKQALREVIEVQDNLQGIFHLAGNNINAAFGDYTVEQMDQILRPKIVGAWNLHELTQEMKLQYFVLFSSIASLLGSNRQAPYVLANGYLDALADYRKHHGLAITHIQWGPWAEEGMSVKDAYDVKIQESFIPLDKGMHLCKQLLAIPQLTRVGVVSPQYLQFMLSFDKHLPSWLESYIQKPFMTSGESEFLQHYYKQSKMQRYPLVEALVEQALKEVLHLTATQVMEREQGFFELGMNSLMAVEMQARINEVLANNRISLRPMLVFDYPTLAKLSTYLYETLEGISPVISITGAKFENEPIAIIGVECRFPAGSDMEHFWKSLAEGQDAICYPEAFRWDVNKYPYSAGFIADIELFDAEFFGISPREAELLDPEQRLLLETTWHALETSGIEPSSLRESETGVFIGISQSEYGQLLAEQSIESDFYQVTGNALNVAAGRLAYTLGLLGPAMAIDTACSSSLVALHEACRSLQNHDCDLAIAGGVNALFEPRIFKMMIKGNMLAPDGWCKTFDAQADGYGRGEGCGVVILKRLKEAQRDHDRILAVIKGSAVNQDGASSGLTVPNGLAQEKVLAKALANANVAPQTIDYIEAHGTGTRLGDPIEIRAIQTIYGPGRDRILTIGTVKTNIGHLESAAGIAGVIKTILALQHEEIPRHLHFKNINPAIHLEAIPAQIPLEPVAWKKEKDRVRRAGISSFGFSGTNAHVIVEEAPEQDLGQVRQPLPKTVFNRRRYWSEVLTHKVQKKVSGEEIHPLLGIRLSLLANHEDIAFEKTLSLEENALQYLNDHRVFTHAVFPAAGYVELLLAALKNQENRDNRILAVELKDIRIELPLGIAENSSVSLQTILTSGENSTYHLAVYSQATDAAENSLWQLHAQGEGALIESLPPFNDLTLTAIRKRCRDKVNIEEFYAKLSAHGLEYGVAFQTVKEIFTGENELLAKVESRGEIESRYRLYPPIFDGALQAISCLQSQSPNVIYLPIGFDKIALYGPLSTQCYVHVLLPKENSAPSSDIVRADLTLLSEGGTIIAKVAGFSAKRTTQATVEKLLGMRKNPEDACYIPIWQPYTLVSEAWEEPAIEPLVYDARDKVHGNVLSLSGVKGLLDLIQIQIQTPENKLPLIIVTEQANSLQGESLHLNQSLLNGFIKTAILEHPELLLRQLDVAEGQAIEPLIAALKQDHSREQLFAYREGQWYVSRVVHAAEANRIQQRLSIPNGPYRLIKNPSGILDELRLMEEESVLALDGNAVVIAPKAVGLNFRDVLNAMNLYPGDPGPLGGDCAGVIQAVGKNVHDYQVGDEVLGVAWGSLASQVITGRELIHLKPRELSFNQAAAIPTIFMTAYYSLITLAGLKAGETILIHAGAGGVGLAAIQIAQYCQAKIIATAGSEEKRAYLQSLGVQHVLDSRSLRYREAIAEITHHQGVNVVLNSLSGRGFIAATLDCTARNGRFIEIGKRDIWSAAEVSAKRSDVMYYIAALDTMSTEEPQTVEKLLTELMSLFENKTLTPIRQTIFSLSQAISAFKYLQQAKQIGKVVLELPPAEITFDRNSSYLITGGLGGVGLVVAQYLSEKGAGRIVLASRHSPSNEAKAFIAQAQNAEIVVFQADVSNKADVEALIRFCHSEKFPLKGVFHLAGIIDDAPLDKQTLERFENVFAPKALGAWYLHELTQEQHITLDYFVLFSSIASLNGSSAQSNYATANSFLDGLAQWRQQQHLTALSINWGPWAEVGMAKELVHVHQRQGLVPFKTREALEALEYVLRQEGAQLGMLQVNWSQMKHITTIPSWLEKLVTNVTESVLLKQLQAAPREQWEVILKSVISQEVRQVLGLSADQTLDEDKGFFEMGMDSLMALELKNRLQGLINKPLSNTIAFDYPTIVDMWAFLLTFLDMGHKLQGQKDQEENKIPSEEISEKIKKMSKSDIDLYIQGEPNE
ncbi:MAG: SDR family NAD(P)-dependent oxidoreductase, partial [Gammaproteobacteria bacterium]